MKSIKKQRRMNKTIEQPEHREPLFRRIKERIIGFDEWCEKNKKKFLLKNNPAEYAKQYGNTK